VTSRAVNMEPREGSASTNRLLGVMIALLLRQGREGPPSLRQQVQTLDDLGLRPSEIASILGRSATYVNKELTGIRKAKKKE
jgi:hypothetical protein